MPLSTVLNSAINKSQQHHEKNYWEHRELNPEPLDENQDCNLCAVQPHVLIKPFCAYNFEAKNQLTEPKKRNSFKNHWNRSFLFAV